NSTNISLSWTASTDNVGVASYTIMRNDMTVGGVVFFNTTSTSFVDTGTDPTHIYSYSVSATDINGLRSGSASVKVSATLPIVDITAPGNGSVVSGTVSVTVDARDNNGIAKVELYVDGNLTSTSTTPPFTNSWNAGRKVAAGAHSLQCKAYDLGGKAGTSAVVQVTK